MTYCATYYLLGESYTVRADSPEALRLLIFGKAYAPNYRAVRYWQVHVK